MEQGIPGKASSRWVICIVVILMTFMSCLDSSIVNIALPAMSAELKCPMSSIEWVVTAYLVVISATILAFGRLGDMHGKARVFQWGTVIFTVSSLGCGLSHSLQALVLWRIAQGIGAAAYMANNQGIIAQTFAPGERGRALGTLGSSVALGNMLGPAVGGFIVTNHAWNGIFFINVPIGIIAMITGRCVLPKEARKPGTLDIPGAVFFAGFIALSIVGVTIGQTRGFADLPVLASLALGVACLVSFITRERSTKSPLLDFALFRNLGFTAALACAAVSFICISSSGILLPFYLVNARSLAPSVAGLILIVSPVLIGILSPLCGALADRYGPKGPSLIGLVLMGAGFLLMATLGQTTPFAFVIAFLSLMAIGQGFFQPSNNTIIMSSVPQNKLGIAGSVNSLVRNLGIVLGVTLSTSLLYAIMSASSGHAVTDYPHGDDGLFIRSIRPIYCAIAAFCLVGASLALARFRRKSARV